MRRVLRQRPGRLRRATAAWLTTGLVVCASAGCTADDTPDPSLPDRSVESQATLEARPVPMDIALGNTVGKRPKRAQRERVEKQIGRMLARYLDAAYLGGEYPRTRFPGAFEHFARGSVPAARRDSDLLTNAADGASIEAVVPRRTRVRLDTLSPQRAVVGATARVRVVFVAERGESADQRVTVTGRYLLSRKKSGPWEIFGYDVKRDSVALQGGTS